MNELQSSVSRAKARVDLIGLDDARKWRALRDLYAEKDELIRERWPYMVDPYPVDWRFTPIEYAAWQTIRYYGLPLYPQYPVGRFFADFADPVSLIAIECDGAAWHDKAKDALRDAETQKLGWRVYRFTGRQCYLPQDHPGSLDSWLTELASSHYGRSV